MLISRKGSVPFLILIYLFSLDHVLSALDRKKYIIGGHSVRDGAYTYQVSISYKDINLCGGGIIGDQFILTAAHCLINDKTGLFEQDKIRAIINAVDLVTLGPSVIKIRVEKMFVPKVFKPQNFKSLSYERPAVLKLKKPIGLVKHLSLIKLQLSEVESDYTGKKAVIAGYRFNWVKVVTDPITKERIEEGGYYGKMRYANTKVITNEECRKVLPNEVHNPEICARVKQHYPEGQKGDSGGLLVYSGSTVIGILNSNPRGCKENVGAGIYTKVANYLDFINNALKEESADDMRVATWIIKFDECNIPYRFLSEESDTLTEREMINQYHTN